VAHPAAAAQRVTRVDSAARAAAATGIREADRARPAGRRVEPATATKILILTVSRVRVARVARVARAVPAATEGRAAQEAQADQADRAADQADRAKYEKVHRTVHLFFALTLPFALASDRTRMVLLARAIS
jgi:hypothetical protein